MGELQVHLNGRLVPASEAKVSVFDAGLLHGASAFTTMRAHKGRVFRLDRHLARLMDTVGLLDLRAGADAAALRQAVAEVLRVNGLQEARMRITLTPGGVKGGEPTALVTGEPAPDAPRDEYDKGISVVVSSFKQARGDVAYGYKTGCYLPRILARQEAARKGAGEALWFTPDNLLAEGCFSNVFLVIDGRACTPPRDTPVLPGIVREAVLELCAALDIPADAETPLTVRQMLSAEEMFLTSSVAGVRPVVRVERHAVGDERPGPVTRKLMQAYDDLLERECSD